MGARINQLFQKTFWQTYENLKCTHPAVLLLGRNTPSCAQEADLKIKMLTTLFFVNPETSMPITRKTDSRTSYGIVCSSLKGGISTYNDMQSLCVTKENCYRKIFTKQSVAPVDLVLKAHASLPSQPGTNPISPQNDAVCVQKKIGAHMWQYHLCL